MMTYDQYHRIRHAYLVRKLTFSQIAAELDIDPETAAKWARLEHYPKPHRERKPSKLDPYKIAIRKWLEEHPYSAVQIHQRLRREYEYPGGYSILKEYIGLVRPNRKPAYLTLVFGPGECAQIDWGSYGSIQIGNERRKLSFFVMVLCYSRMIYVEFSLGQKLEHFLSAHHNALCYFGSVPEKFMIDNLKTGVIRHSLGQPALFNPRYLDFAAQCGAVPVACNVRKGNEKGRVETGVDYVKKNFLKGLTLPPGLDALNAAARDWMETIANCRIHGETKKRPCDLFALEKPCMRPLPFAPPDLSVVRTARVTNRCRVHVETNKYSVPSLYASQLVDLRIYADRICIYHRHKLIATHRRSYERNLDIEDPDHLKELLEQRKNAKEQQLLLNFYNLSPKAELFHHQLVAKTLNVRHHIRQILALVDSYGSEQIARLIEDAVELNACTSQCILNLLEQRHRFAQLQEPGPLHLTRSSDLLDIQLKPADLSIYQ
jgi:transposase